MTESSIFALLLLLVTVRATQAAEYVLLGVSGGLQDGFPEHPKMDYQDDGEISPAVFVGRGLVRGYKAYLDVMELDWRQYVDEPGQPLINCNVIPTGCWQHANEYWIYLVDMRRFISILMNEPRFLSVAPDLGLVDLQAEETSGAVRHIALSEIKRQEKSNTTAVAIPIVTGAWYNENSHVLSPVLYTKEDGTEVTNFPQSLAKWAGMDPLVQPDTCQADREVYPHHTYSDYWDNMRKAIRTAEINRESMAAQVIAPHQYHCVRKARFGVSSDHARINFPFQGDDIKQILSNGGYSIDFGEALIKASPVKAV